MKTAAQAAVWRPMAVFVAGGSSPFDANSLNNPLEQRQQKIVTKAGSY